MRINGGEGGEKGGRPRVKRGKKGGGTVQSVSASALISRDHLLGDRHREKKGRKGKKPNEFLLRFI